MEDREKSGASAGMAVAVLGILMIIGLLVLKFAGPESIMGIDNPQGTYGSYFLGGLAVSVIVMIIGGMMAGGTKEEPTEEEYEEEFEEEFEEDIEEEGICPTCGAVIPIDSDECPECGEELEPPEEEEEVVEEQECPICGAEVPADADECPECGEPLGEESEEDVFEDL